MNNPCYRNSLARKHAVSILSAFLLAAILLVGSGGGAALAQETASPYTPDELRREIESRTEELNKLNEKIEETEARLEEVQGEKRSLQQQINSINYSINQLELNIKADEITAEKLAFEIQSLEQDLDNIAATIDTREEAVGRLFRNLYKADQRNLVMILLAHQSIAESLDEVQSIESIRSQLTLDIKNLRDLTARYRQTLVDVRDKREEIVLRRKAQANRKVILEDKQEERGVILAQTKNQESLYQQQLNELYEQQRAISDEIAIIEERLRAAFDPSLLPAKRPGVLAWPVRNVIITQHYGETAYSSYYGGKPHNGTDIGVPTGTEIFAADNGIITAVGNNDANTWRKYQYGKYILVNHGNNLSTLYAHLSGQVVSEGQEVKRGDLIGYSGNTGFSTGPHLHFGLYWTPSIEFISKPPAQGLIPIGVTVSPEDYL